MTKYLSIEDEFNKLSVDGCPIKLPTSDTLITCRRNKDKVDTNFINSVGRLHTIIMITDLGPIISSSSSINISGMDVISENDTTEFDIFMSVEQGKLGDMKKGAEVDNVLVTFSFYEKGFEIDNGEYLTQYDIVRQAENNGSWIINIRGRCLKRY